jgi:hypothetical protein
MSGPTGLWVELRYAAFTASNTHCSLARAPARSTNHKTDQHSLGHWETCGSRKHPKQQPESWGYEDSSYDNAWHSIRLARNPFMTCALNADGSATHATDIAC